MIVSAEKVCLLQRNRLRNVCPGLPNSARNNDVSSSHNLLLSRLKKLNADNAGQPPTAQQWADLLDSAEQTRTISEQEHTSAVRRKEISALKMQQLYQRITEAQRIAGLGNWSFNRELRMGQWSEESFRIFGLDPSLPPPSYKELSKRIHMDDRVQVKDCADAAIHDSLDFEIEFRLLMPNNETRWVRAMGQPVKNSKGSVTRVHGTVMDVTRRKRIELRQSMEYTVTRFLAESDSPAEVMPEIIQTICESIGAVCGALWTMNKKDSSLQRTAVWSTPSPQVEQFFSLTDNRIPKAATTGLVGQVLQTGKPTWIPDLTQDAYYSKNSPASASQLYVGYALPILAGGEILGILEFFGRQSQQGDKEMFLSATFIGRHIGQYFQRKQAEDALKESEEHFRSLVEQASDSFYVHDIDGEFINVNQPGCDGLGYTRAELLGMSIKDVDIDLSLKELKSLPAQIAKRTPISRESRYRRKDGTIFPVEIRTGPIEINGHQHLLSLVRDVTERKELQDHIKHLAYHDALTDLPNRAMFNRHLSHAIAQARRHDKHLAVLFIDLDRFKNINDTLGHDAGDRLLQEMSQRLTASLKSADLVARIDSPKDLVARLGGDEFVVLIEDAHDSARISHIAHKILTSVIEEYSLNDQIVHITASIGISIFPEDGKDEFTLMKHADIAMYRAKDKGKNNFQFYSAQMSLHTAQLLALESSLHTAIERKELVLHYQAKVDTKSKRVIGVEALVRWQHPELGLLPPDQFIPLAEEIGFIVSISKWVLYEACEQSREWQAQGIPALQIAVNMSARQFDDDTLLADTEKILHDTDMDPTLLELEITESMMMHNPEKTIQILAGLRAMGIRIAIDDFGIGFSSLSHLKKFPIDIIKIDRSFIQDIPGDEADEAITEAIIAMGKSLKLTVVAEGVETAEQLQFLSTRNCDEIQGYFFSEPIPADVFAKLYWKNMEQNTDLPMLSRT